MKGTATTPAYAPRLTTEKLPEGFSRVGRPAREFFHAFDHFDTTRGLLAWVVAHIVVAQLMAASVAIATLVAVAMVGVVMYLIATTKNLTYAVALLCYIGCGDVLWRMTEARVPWEGAKYLLVIGSILLMVRFVGRPHATLAAGFIILLLPSLAAPLLSSGLGYMRDRLSFVLMGPIALAVCVMSFQRLRAHWTDLRIVMWAMIGPIAGVASIASLSTSRLTGDDFGSIQSNIEASGGYGPNQVSAIIGLAMLFCLLLLLIERNWMTQIMLVVMAAWFFGQTALTFSRGGLANVAVAAMLALPHLIAHKKVGARVLVAFGIISLVLVLFVLPGINTFTDGGVDQRLAQRDSTLRATLAEGDLQSFEDNPLFGSGAGGSDEYHRIDGAKMASHTEWTRLPAEHGLLGLAAIGCLLGISFQAYARQTNWLGRAWTAGLVGWAFMELTHASTRNATGAIVFAMAMIVIDDSALFSDRDNRIDAARRGRRTAPNRPQGFRPPSRSTETGSVDARPDQPATPPTPATSGTDTRADGAPDLATPSAEAIPTPRPRSRTPTPRPPLPPITF